MGAEKKSPIYQFFETFNKDDELNNDFMIDFSEKLKIYGSKYDASNLTNAFDNNKSNNFFDVLFLQTYYNILNKQNI